MRKFKKLSAVLGILMTITMTIPSTFAETGATDNGDSSGTANVQKQDNKSDEGASNEPSTPKTTNVSSKKDDSSSVNVRFSDRGNGSFNYRLSTAAEETSKEVYAGKTSILAAHIGDEIEISTYALDGNKTNIDVKDVEITKEISYGNNCKLVYVKIIGSNPSVDINFAGGESLGSSKPAKMAMARGVGFFRAPASSMSVYVNLSKYQYGYKSGGSRYYPNKYGLFTSGTSGVYGGAVFCSEHDRTPTMGSMTGYVMNDSTIRKILYYGYKGPAQWSGFSSSSYNGSYKVWGSNTNRTEIAGTVITSQALSNRFNSLGGRGTATNPAGLSAFMSYVNSQPDPGSTYTAYKATASGQDMMWGVYNPKGKLQLVKEVKNNKTLTEQCKNMYSLAGAEYYVSKNRDGSGYVGMFTTKEDGSTDPIELDAGRYYVKEVKAPKGYALDTEIYSVNVSSGNTSWVTSKDEPLFDPVAIMLFKTSDGESYLNTEKDMSGAEFEISYYDEMFDNADEAANKTPVRKWVLQTQKNANTNKYQASLRDKYKVAGDDFFKNEQGAIVIPRGTITIREIKAPKGFKVDPSIYVTHVDNDLHSNDKLVYNFGNAPEQPNKPLVPKIGTTALDTATTDNVGSHGKKVKLVDKVSYKQLSEGETYTVKGKLMDKATGQPLLVNGREVTAEKTFTVTNANSTITGDGASGSVDLEYEVDSTVLVGKTTVVFEHLYYDGKEIATHADIDDEGQSVHFPKIGTTAKSRETNSNLGMPRANETIIDTVKYENLFIGKVYTVKGKLMDKATKQPIKDEHGNEITASKTFTATSKSGSVDLEYTYNSLHRQGKTTVVFEDMYHNDKLVATHSDINDEGQSIEYPNIHTKADVKQLGKLKDGNITIVDKVFYKNLTIGKVYTVKGKLMDKATGQPLLVNGREVTAEKTFTATRNTGSIEVEFTLPAKVLQGKTTVVFEDMYNDGVKIATHSDITDINQTIAIGRLDVNFPYGGHGLGSVKTGDPLALGLTLMILGISSMLLVVVIRAKKRANEAE
ncbi:VaFE repeat-containing surface-anchored protein [Mogibacterium timidum]|uniref:VaFE repeat-containing surface-anchored protein n=1 Tax=Mogibacterium timidum TaxID=35519 RepID=A0A7Y8VR10_9FIRM|nr:VaFE repeat-containing surface-anchored protein [Mogibacterium timidum]NWO23026.1 VaFE repeat-containing surface-anchored protein [Mogibacterium timidum]